MKKSATFPISTVVKTSLLSLLFSAFFFSACSDDKKQLETLSQATETAHDVAMKDLADMNRIARELKESMVASTMTPEQSAVYNDVLTSMGKAENNMMDWMKNYKPIDAMASEEALIYLQEQKTLIEKNQVDIKAALEAGKKLQGK